MLNFQKSLLYFNTIRHLRAVQIYGRLWHKFRSPAPILDPPPQKGLAVGHWEAPALREQSLYGPYRFRMLNREHSLKEKGGWEPPEATKLWLYHLHYFDDLTAFNFHKRRSWHKDLIHRWIKENPPVSGIGWESYPLSRRIINWIKADLTKSLLDGAVLHSLAVQTRYLAKRCEHHLQGNHLFVNAKALVFAGLYFGGRFGNRETGSWLKQGSKIINRELTEQIRSDGSHYEQSPMYHALFFEDLLDMINIGRAYGWDKCKAWESTACRMFSYLNAVCHPDGRICLFNDAAFNMAPAPEELADYACRMGIRPNECATAGPGWRQYRNSGMVRLQLGAWTIFFDTGPIGPDHIPGHAHADNLTIEFSYQDQRIIVDTGSGEYGTSPERLRQRGTSSHNTVVLDGQNSSEIWSGFRVARRAVPLDIAHIEKRGNTLICESCYEVCGLLKNHIHHRRTLCLNEEKFTVEDEIGGKGKHQIEIFWHFHPQLTLKRKDDFWIVFHERLKKNIGKISIGSMDEIFTEQTTYHPEVGLSLNNTKLAGRKKGNLPVRITTQFLFDK